jgi:hypothetical protein
MAKKKKDARKGDFFFRREDVERVASKRVRWQAAYRLIPTRYPPINVFERIAPPEDWEALIELEGLTNPRLRQEAGAIALVPSDRRVSGPGASIVMAPFTHVSKSRPTRFSDGSYGVYYAAHQFETALREVAFHMGRFYAATGDPPLTADYRSYKGKIDKVMHDIRDGRWNVCLDPDPATYGTPQKFAQMLRDAGSNGIVYPSVRHEEGECIAAFWPDVVAIPVQERHIALKWDGERLSDWFDYASETWFAL